MQTFAIIVAIVSGAVYLVRELYLRFFWNGEI